MDNLLPKSQDRSQEIYGSDISLRLDTPPADANDVAQDKAGTYPLERSTARERGVGAELKSRASVLYAAQQNPSDIVAARELGVRYGLPEDLVLRNLDQLKRQAKLDDALSALSVNASGTQGASAMSVPAGAGSEIAGAPMSIAKMDDLESEAGFGGLMPVNGSANSPAPGNDNLLQVQAAGDSVSGGTSNHRPMRETETPTVNQSQNEPVPANANHSGAVSLDQPSGSPNHRPKSNRNRSDKNDPVEPSTFTFELNNQSMSALKDSEGMSYPAFSGLPGAKNDPSKTALEKFGPLPKGTYYIINRQPGGRRAHLRQWFDELGLPGVGGWIGRRDKDEWFALYRMDGEIDDTTTIDGVQRGQFRLHPIGDWGISEGCITVDSKEDYAKIRHQLLENKPRLIPGTNIPYYGTVQVK